MVQVHSIMTKYYQQLSREEKGQIEAFSLKKDGLSIT